jgi:transposase InsO family protein
MSSTPVVGAPRRADLRGQWLLGDSTGISNSNSRAPSKQGMVGTSARTRDESGPAVSDEGYGQAIRHWHLSDKAAPCPLDHVNRQFKAAHPNALWLSDFMYVATWAGFVYVAFVIDAYARRIVGLAGVANGARRLRARRPGAGSA